MALEWDTAKLSSCTAVDGRGTRVCSGWHAAQMQVNTSRDSVTAAVPPFKNVSVSPPPPSTHSLFRTLASRSHTPTFQSKPFLHAELPFLHLKWHSLLSIFAHHKSLHHFDGPCHPSRRGRDQPLVPRGTFSQVGLWHSSQNVRVNDFYCQDAQKSAKVAYSDLVRQLSVKTLRCYPRV